MSDKRIFLWRAVYLNFPSAPAVPLLVSLFGSMVIFVAFLLEISAGFFLPAHLSAKSRTLVAYFGLEDLEILKKIIVKTQKMAHLHVGASFFILLVAPEVRLL